MKVEKVLNTIMTKPVRKKPDPTTFLGESKKDLFKKVGEDKSEKR